MPGLKALDGHCRYAGMASWRSGLEDRAQRGHSLVEAHGCQPEHLLTGHLPLPNPRCCHPRPKPQSWPLFAGVSMGQTEHFHRGLWKTEPVCGQGCPEIPASNMKHPFLTILPPHTVLDEARIILLCSCISKELTNPCQRPQGRHSLA